MAEEVAEELGAAIPSLVEDDIKRMRPPNRKKFDEEMDRLQNQIKEKDAELEELKTTGGSATNELKNLKAEKIATIERRKQIDIDLEKLNKDIPEKMRRLNQLESSLYYKNEEKINMAIQRLEWNLKVQTFKLMEEKKIVSEIDSLKRSKKTLVQYLALKQEISGIRDQQRRMREERDTYFRNVTKLKIEEDKVRKDSSMSRGRFTNLKREIDELYEQKRQLLGNYKKQKEEYNEVKEKQRKESQRKREDNRKSLTEDKRKQLQGDLEPEKLYEQEINLCNALIKYLSQFSSLPVQDPSVDSLSPASSVDEPELAEEIDDGQYVLLRKSGEFEGLDYSGGIRRLSKKNRRPRKQSMIKKLKHSPVTLEQFTELDVHAPNAISEVPAALANLYAKKAFFEKEQWPNEAASDTGISATESAMCEMSRQASKTESCEGAIETYPGEQVYADLLCGCQEGQKDLPEGWEVEGAARAKEDFTSDILSPNSDSTVEGDSGSGESQSSVCEISEKSRECSEGNTVEKENCEESAGLSQVSHLSPCLKKVEIEGSDMVQLRNTDCRPKSKYNRQSHHPATNRWSIGGKPTLPLPSPLSAPVGQQALSITSPLDFPSLNAFLSSDSSIKSPKSASLNLRHIPLSPTHRTLAARLSNPSTPTSSVQGQNSRSLAVLTMPQPQSTPVLSNEDFPPLSQTTSQNRRGSSLSTKSSSGSSAVQEQQLQSSASLESQQMPVSGTLISDSNISVPSGNLMPESQQFHHGSSYISPSTVEPADPLSVSDIPSADKSSTEKWVESSVAFTKDFKPIHCENTAPASITESTKL